MSSTALRPDPTWAQARGDLHVACGPLLEPLRGVDSRGRSDIRLDRGRPTPDEDVRA